MEDNGPKGRTTKQRGPKRQSTEDDSGEEKEIEAPAT